MQLQKLAQELKELYPDIPIAINEKNGDLSVKVKDNWFPSSIVIPINNESKEVIRQLAEDTYKKRMAKILSHKKAKPYIDEVFMLRNLKQIRCVGATMNLEPIFERMDYPDRKYVLLDNYADGFSLYTLEGDFEEPGSRIRTDWQIDSYLYTITLDEDLRCTPIYVDSCVWEKIGDKTRERLSHIARKALDKENIEIDKEFQEAWDIVASGEYEDNKIEGKRELFEIASDLENILRNSFDDISIDDNFCQYVTREDAKAIVNAYREYSETKKLKRKNAVKLKM